MKKNTSKQSELNTILRRINGLSVGDVAHCGEYGDIKCTRAAVREFASKGCVVCAAKARQFSVSKSKVLSNGGLWTMAKFRAALFSK